MLFHHKFSSTMCLCNICGCRCICVYCDVRRCDRHAVCRSWWKALSSGNQISFPGNCDFNWLNNDLFFKIAKLKKKPNLYCSISFIWIAVLRLEWSVYYCSWIYSILLTLSLRAGSRWSTSAFGVAACAKSSGKTARRESDFLGNSSPDSFPPDRFSLPRSRAWLKGEPARGLSDSGVRHDRINRGTFEGLKFFVWCNWVETVSVICTAI